MPENIENAVSTPKPNKPAMTVRVFLKIPPFMFVFDLLLSNEIVIVTNNIISTAAYAPFHAALYSMVVFTSLKNDRNDNAVKVIIRAVKNHEAAFALGVLITLSVAILFIVYPLFVANVSAKLTAVAAQNM